MTVTTTTRATDPTGLSGHDYPQAAAVEAEGYWWHLARLRESTTRELAAEHAEALARAAGHIAAALAGTPGAEPDTATDPVAWTDLATYLTRLALALHGAQMNPGPHDDPWQDSDEDYYAWEDLAGAAARREFAAAWQPVRENLQRLAAPGENGAAPQVRAFTTAQVTRAAAAVLDAPW
jgi:hypothetical protein